MRRVILSAAVVTAALLLQLTVVNRLPWPGAGAPDLVLLVVVALGLSGRPAAGAVTGFLAGLGLDIAPPASFLIGEYALVFCVVGYGCGLLRGLCGESVWRSVAAAVAATAAGEALVCAVGLLVGDPQVSWLAIRHVLPSSVAYDAALSPFVLYLVIRLLAWAGALGPGNQLAGAQLAQARSPAQARAAPAALPGGAGLLGGAGWLAGPKASRGDSKGGGTGRSPGRVPRLREAAARPRDGWIGGGRPTWRAAGRRTGASRPLRLRPASGQAGSAAAVPLRRELQRRPVNLRLGSRRGRAARPGTGSSGPAFRRQGSSGPGRPSVAATGRPARHSAAAAQVARPSALAFRVTAVRRRAAAARACAAVLAVVVPARAARRSAGHRALPDRLCAGVQGWPDRLCAGVQARPGRPSGVAAPALAARRCAVPVMAPARKRSGAVAGPAVPSPAAGQGQAGRCWPARGHQPARRDSGRTPGCPEDLHSARPGGC